ncbi:dolichol-phosphate mannosyltransferase [Algoriphagus boritolerans DSM 17298 = JCM 18970]|uniref:Dolichol-phosphate mannosyltransferase n=2 Tax=Algoriphagus TaxID=246875 RepID=A0A1H5Y7H1_9BACT|nr:dolichol-phosphate mannosyltransferase [Algoriphagus boritolerans DSM 17298 = JCM 18970]
MHLSFPIVTKLHFKQNSRPPLFKNPSEILLLTIDRTMNHQKLVIIPTFNELENIREMVQTVMALDGDFSLLVIDDGSPDGTAAVVKSLQAVYPERLHLIERKGKLGLGTAYITGFKWALKHSYEFIFEMDCDFSHDPKDLIRLYDAVKDRKYDLAIGSRYITGVNVVNWPIGRVLMSYFASVYVKFITGLPVKDATAGFKCYHRSVLEGIRLDEITFIGYAFQIEMKFTTWKLGFKIIEVPIIFTDRTKGTSKMSSGIFKEAVLGVIWMKIKSIFSLYKLNQIGSI